jgi:F-type H+-transporting ATPase subunit gamma
MLTLEALRRQMDSAEDLRGIVHTMKTMAAVSIRQYQRAVESLAEYQRTIGLGLQAVLAEQAEDATPDRPQPGAATLAVIFGSDQGMVGQFNEQVVSHALEALARRSLPPDAQVLVAVGERARARLAAAGHAIAESLAVPASATGITPVAQTLLRRLDHWRARQPVARVELFYNALTRAASFRPRGVCLMPIALSELRRSPESAWPPRSFPTFRLERPRLLSALLRQHLFVTLFRALAESLASENASRLAAMQAAERNIEERLAELTMQYHQQRQSAITSELLDIVSGFEVLTGRQD